MKHIRLIIVPFLLVVGSLLVLCSCSNTPPQEASTGDTALESTEVTESPKDDDNSISPEMVISQIESIEELFKAVKPKAIALNKANAKIGIEGFVGNGGIFRVAEKEIISPYGKLICAWEFVIWYDTYLFSIDTNIEDWNGEKIESVIINNSIVVDRAQISGQADPFDDNTYLGSITLYDWQKGNDANEPLFLLEELLKQDIDSLTVTFNESVEIDFDSKDLQQLKHLLELFDYAEMLVRE